MLHLKHWSITWTSCQQYNHEYVHVYCSKPWSMNDYLPMGNTAKRRVVCKSAQLKNLPCSCMRTSMGVSISQTCVLLVFMFEQVSFQVSHSYHFCCQRKRWQLLHLYIWLHVHVSTWILKSGCLLPYTSVRSYLAQLVTFSLKAWVGFQLGLIRSTVQVCNIGLGQWPSVPPYYILSGNDIRLWFHSWELGNAWSNQQPFAAI